MKFYVNDKNEISNSRYMYTIMDVYLLIYRYIIEVYAHIVLIIQPEIKFLI